MDPPPTDGYSISLRLRLTNKAGVLGVLTSTFGAIGGSIGAIDIVEVGFEQLVRDITIAAGNDRSVFNRHVAPAVAAAVEEAAYRTGVARRERSSQQG
jgi:hypothetical protein